MCSRWLLFITLDISLENTNKIIPKHAFHSKISLSWNNYAVFKHPVSSDRSYLLWAGRGTAFNGRALDGPTGLPHSSLTPALHSLGYCYVFRPSQTAPSFSVHHSSHWSCQLPPLWQLQAILTGLHIDTHRPTNSRPGGKTTSPRLTHTMWCSESLAWQLNHHDL